MEAVSRRLHGHRLPALLLVLLVGACGGEGNADAGGADASLADGSVPAPEMPAPPLLLPCPEGWTEVGADPVTCEPWPEGGRADCTGHTTHFPGEPGCVPVGTACPAGDFPDDPPRGAVFVLAGAAGGDGSAASPFGSLREAATRAFPNATVLVGPGIYDEVITVARPMTIRGVCPERTVLTSSTPDSDEGVVNVRGVEASIRIYRSATPSASV